MGWLAFFQRWLRPGAASRADLHFIVYTRDGCHLCDDAWEMLERIQQTYGFVLEAKNVDSSTELTKEYGDSVPVVTINGKVRFRGRVDRILLQRILDARTEP